MKDHLIPLPVAGEPGTYGIRFADRLYRGTRDDCRAEVDALQDAARRHFGDVLLAEARREEYAQTWAPLLARRSLPAYIASVVPDWAREMHEAATEAAA
ncbi:MAG TPA: hypothetical protein VMT43_07440 [Acidimicrobiales bacterium]|nr:hypothetical protein [Acidimicrobiales bacterium]